MSEKILKSVKVTMNANRSWTIGSIILPKTGSVTLSKEQWESISILPSVGRAISNEVLSVKYFYEDAGGGKKKDDKKEKPVK